MSKDARTKKQGARRSGGAAAGSDAERTAERIDFIEIRPGLFLNVDHIVSLRVLPQEDDGAYAILQLSNGDKLNLTSSEFSAISGEKPRPPARRAQNSLAKQ